MLTDTHSPEIEKPDREAAFRPLAERLLKALRDQDRTPLREVDPAAIVHVAVHADTSRSGVAWDEARPALDAIVGRALGSGGVFSAGRSRPEAPSRPRGEDGRNGHPTGRTDGALSDPDDVLVEWVRTVHRTMRQVHPTALDILVSRVRGEELREIAEELDLGLRLVRRLLAEMEEAWRSAREGSPC